VEFSGPYGTETLAGTKLWRTSFPESHPKDPQDRSIGVTALVEGAGLVTHDRGIAKSDLVPVIW
jgi:PIN domain nuclease of toxin-antitoxin system